MNNNAVIFGAGGFVGAELLRLSLAHPYLQLKAAVSESQAGQAIGDVYKNLAPMTSLKFTSLSEVSLPTFAPCTLFSALGHGTTMAKLAPIIKAGQDIKIIDLSGDFRLHDKTQYERYYGINHSAPEYLQSFVYGLPELYRKNIASAQRIANPGCFATAALLSILPAAAAKWPIVGIALDGKTGSSGAGIRPRTTTHHPQRMNNFQAYRQLDHQHMGEIEMGFIAAGGKKQTSLSFVPQMAPLVRGIFMSAHIFLENEISEAEIVDTYSTYYRDEPMVQLVPNSPCVTQVWGTNRCDLSVLARQKVISVCTAIDNLGKGAAGQAIQNANILNGWEETAGLLVPPPWPV